MFKLIFDDRGGHLSDDDRDCAAKICTETAAELQTLLPALPNLVRVNIASRGRVIPQLGFSARATTMDSVSLC
jgi:hypothetical protein